MSLLGRIIGQPGGAVRHRREPTIAAQSGAAKPSGTMTPDPWFTELGWGPQSRVASLPRVTPDIAQRHATVYACCNVISGDLSKIPMIVAEQISGGRFVRVKEHALDYLLNAESSDGVPAHVPRFMMIYGFTLRGVGYAYAPRDGAGEPTLIEGISPNKCTMQRVGRERFYDIEDGAGVYRRAPSRSMVHMRYMADDGWTGRSPISVAAESIGLALAGQEAAARAATGLHLRGYVKLEDNFEDEEQYVRSAKRISEAIRNPEHKGWPVIGSNDAIETLDISASDQELLSSRKFDREQIAAIYRVPPSKLQMLEFGVKANGQQQAIDYKTDCLLHWGNMSGQFMSLGLLTKAERERGLVLQHDYDALMQATTKERYDALTRAVGGPFMTWQEARKIEGLEDLPEGVSPYPPTNMTRTDGADNSEKENPDD